MSCQNCRSAKFCLPGFACSPIVYVFCALAEREDPGSDTTTGPDRDADSRITKPVEQGKKQIEAADQGHPWNEARGESFDSCPGRDRQRG